MKPYKSKPVSRKSIMSHSHTIKMDDIGQGKVNNFVRQTSFQNVPVLYVQLGEALEEQFQRNHPRHYQFQKRLEKANPNCDYFRLQRGIA